MSIYTYIKRMTPYTEDDIIQNPTVERLHPLDIPIRSETLDFARDMEELVKFKFFSSMDNLYDINDEPKMSIPSIPFLSNVPTIDDQSFIELNNLTGAEQVEKRGTFMLNVIFKDANQTSCFLIENTTTRVRSYLNHLLIRAFNDIEINEFDFYEIGNIFIYTILGIDYCYEGRSLREVVDNLRVGMINYNNQNNSLLDNNIRLSTEEEEDRPFVSNQRRLLSRGLGAATSVALTSIGAPPVGGLISNSILSYMENRPS